MLRAYFASYRAVRLGDAFAMSRQPRFWTVASGLDAGEAGVVTKRLELLATIVGAL